MTWDPERYREKREKVLGVRKRGVSFGTLTAVAALVIMAGMASLSLPGAVSYIQTRHLDDAIFRLKDNRVWPGDLVAALGRMDGVAKTALDTHNTRLVVTFDRRHTRPEAFSALFASHDLTASLLNRVSHRQRANDLASEKEAEGETP